MIFQWKYDDNIGKPMCGQVDQVRLESAQHKAFIEVTKNSLMTMMEMMALMTTIIVVKMRVDDDDDDDNGNEEDESETGTAGDRGGKRGGCSNGTSWVLNLLPYSQNYI